MTAFFRRLSQRGLVSCEDCGRSVRAWDSVWRGSRAYCCASHEHADWDI